MTTINRATWLDDDGSGMTGTILNNARLQGDVYDPVDAALASLDGKNASQDTAITANGPHGILSAQHPTRRRPAWSPATCSLSARPGSSRDCRSRPTVTC